MSVLPCAAGLIDRAGALVTCNARFAALMPAPFPVDAIRQAAAQAGTDWAPTLLPRADGGQATGVVVPVRDGVLLLLRDEPEGSVAAGEIAALHRRIRELELQATTDPLTGAWNRAHFDRIIPAECARSAGNRQPLSLVLIDLDHFKSINDRYGHPCGDQVLADLAAVLKAGLRPSDLLFRWGGEEFLVLAPACGYRGAGRLGERLRAAVGATAFAGAGTVTISAGVAERLPAESLHDWYERADRMLYAAKEQGRDRVVVDATGASDAWADASAPAPLKLIWQEAYESGDDAIDAEHRALFATANRILDCIGPGTPPNGLADAFSAFIDDVEQHFSHEEAFLARIGHANVEAHGRIHAALLRRAKTIRARLAVEAGAVGDALRFLVGDLVVGHLIGVDSGFFPDCARVQAGRVAYLKP